jgi:dethiobiotin synthase
VVFVTGTGTEVGKTWLSCAAGGQLRSRGRRVSVRKPLQSHDRRGGPTDAQLLAEASGEDVACVCPAERTFEVALAPPMAAIALGRRIAATAELAAALGWAEETEVGLVEGAGGIRSPLSADGDNLDLLAYLDTDHVVVVAEAGLGVVNAVRLTTDVLGARPVTAFLNRFDPSDEVHTASCAWLRDRDGLDVAVTVGELVETLEGRLQSPLRR